ncbi:MAG: methionyl-tRNA formyltransferase [Lachnospiraceae bacterium]|nr:methionyl-tRNA formyltransferase [Lachnospiraceae bacterium]
MKNVIFMGTPDFAVGTLNALLASDYTVQAVFTQPDKPKGRGKAMQMTPVKEAALEAGIPVYQPRRIREPENLEILKEYCPDVIVVVAFGQMIPEEILKLPPYGCINVHASLLPKYRGAAPIQWAVIDGEKESGVTTMRMDTGLDTGDMILKETVPLAADETGGSLFDKLSVTGAGLLIRTLQELEAGTAVFEKQPEESPTPYAAMLKKQMGRIDWTKDAVSIERLIRGLNPWPSAYTLCRGKTLKIWEAQVEEETDGETEAAAEGQRPVPGSVVLVTKQLLKIQTGKGLLSVREVQLEGKKRMAADAFLRGFPIEEGELLGE